MLCRRYGYTCFGDHDDEIAIQPDPNSPPYYLDICAVSGPRILCIEVDGYKGHKSRRAICKDKHRTNEIKSYFKRQGVKGTVEFYRFAFWQLTDIDDATIAEELKLC